MGMTFVYVWLVYYHDPYEEDFVKRMHFGSPMVCASMRRCTDLLRSKKVDHLLKEINPGQIWRAGNYWVERQPIIDSYNEGLEYERRIDSTTVTSGRIPITPAGLTSS